MTQQPWDTKAVFYPRRYGLSCVPRPQCLRGNPDPQHVSLSLGLETGPLKRALSETDVIGWALTQCDRRTYKSREVGHGHMQRDGRARTQGEGVTHTCTRERGLGSYPACQHLGVTLMSDGWPPGRRKQISVAEAPGVRCFVMAPSKPMHPDLMNERKGEVASERTPSLTGFPRSPPWPHAGGVSLSGSSAADPEPSLPGAAAEQAPPFVLFLPAYICASLLSLCQRLR